MYVLRFCAIIGTMSATDCQNIDIEQNSDKPDVEALKELYDKCAADCNVYASKAADNADVRFCRWSGQTPDCRKHGSQKNPAFPWNGASDTRVFLVDQIIRENVALKIAALSRAVVKPVPIGAQNAQNAGSARELIRWLTSPAKMPEFRREMVRVANWAEESGAAVMGFYYERQTELAYQTANVKEVCAASEAATAFLALAQNPFMPNGVPVSQKDIDDAKASAARELAENLNIAGGETEAKKFLNDIAQMGVAQYRTPKLVCDRPKVKAFRIGATFFMPAQIDDIQDAPAVFTLEFFAPFEIRNKVTCDGWSKKFADNVVENSCTRQRDENTERPNASDSASDGTFTSTVRIATAYYRAHDSDGNVALRFCIFCPDNPEAGEAKAGLLGYAPSRMPFEILTSEQVSPNILDARGTPEIARCWQADVKTQRDARNDRTSLEACPPRYYAAGRVPPEYGPRAMIPVRGDVNDIVREAPVAPLSANSMQIELGAVKSAAAYFGKITENVGQIEATALREMQMTDFLEFVSRVYLQIYWLHRQFGPEVEYMLFSAADTDEGSAAVSKDDLPERYWFYVSYDVANNDGDYLWKKIEYAIKAFAALDRQGRVNTDPLVDAIAHYLFPDIADRMIVPSQNADMREMLETQSDLAKIFSGQAINAPEHCNRDLRKHIVEQYLQSPDIAARLQNDRFFAERLQTYVAQLDFQQQQELNAVIGRTGTAPAPLQPSNMEIAQL